MQDVLILKFVVSVLIVACEGEYERLPTNLTPIRYALIIQTDLNSAASYTGWVSIDLQVNENTTEIALHKKNLKIDPSDIVVIDNNNKTIKIAGTTYKNTSEIYVITPQRPLIAKQRYQLLIQKFTNNLNDQNVGFYSASKNLALTDFQPSDARAAFPCFDEPSFKSKFIISIVRGQTQNSASNAQLAYTVNLSNGLYQDIYEETPPMSTYLVAWAVFDYKTTRTSDRNRIIGRPKDVDRNHFDYALETSAKILRELEKYTGVKFALKKLDHLAVPDLNFRDEAMENWGLIVYKEADLLHNDKATAKDLKQSVTCIAHEVAHQWFGNLVTPSWWDYIWLSESFAAYLQYYIGDIVEPTWKLMDQFVVDSLHVGFTLDEDKYSIPLNYKTQALDDFPLLHVFYTKGSSILRMAQHFLTEAVFKNGLRMFLTDRQYGIADPSHFYQALQRAVDAARSSHLLPLGLSVMQILSVWDSLEGLPLVTVTRNYTGNLIKLEQHRYYFKGKLLLKQNWSIPITLICESSGTEEFLNTATDAWLTSERMEIKFECLGHNWLVVNKQQVGYYRVNYDEDNWELLIAFMNSPQFRKMHLLNRAQLIDDAFSLAKSKLIPYTIPLRLCRYLSEETDYVPFKAFYKGVDAMDTKELNKNSEEFKEYMFKALSKVHGLLGFKVRASDTLVDRLNRIELVDRLCELNHADCLNYAQATMKEIVTMGRSRVHPDVEQAVLCKGIEAATENEYDLLLGVFTNSSYPFERTRLRAALSCNGPLSYKKMHLLELEIKTDP